jgi:hypothetical protein
VGGPLVYILNARSRLDSSILFLAAAFVTAFFPNVLPRLTNAYYSRIGMKTRIAEEDYHRVGTRIAGAILLVLGLIVAYRIVLSGH